MEKVTALPQAEEVQALADFTTAKGIRFQVWPISPQLSARMERPLMLMVLNGCKQLVHAFVSPKELEDLACALDTAACAAPADRRVIANSAAIDAKLLAGSAVAPNDSAEPL